MMKESIIPVLIILAAFSLVSLRHLWQTGHNFFFPTNDVKESIVSSGNAKATIAYAVSLTKCKKGDGNLRSAMGVISESARRNSFENPSSGSKYSHRMVAFVHPDAEKCESDVRDMGYEVLRRDAPVSVTEIRGEFLRTHLKGSGAGGNGEKEFLKLYSYTLMEHPVVVHLDLDTIILRPMDELFDALIDGEESSSWKSLPLQSRYAVRPRNIEAFITRDYGMINTKGVVGMQAGFFVVKPDMERFTELRDIVKEGDFKRGQGWGGGVVGGAYYGDMRLQGLLAYYYDFVQRGKAAELDRCVYNNMADDPYDDDDTCLDGTESPCKDCRDTPLAGVAVAHFTHCQKPWGCKDWKKSNSESARLCMQFYYEWYKTLNSAGKTLGTVHQSNNTYKPDLFFGHCNSTGAFIPI